jgi:hypothetical protein
MHDAGALRPLEVAGQARRRRPRPQVFRALSELRAAVAAVSSSGQIQGTKAEQLKRVEELAKHVSEKVR